MKESLPLYTTGVPLEPPEPSPRIYLLGGSFNPPGTHHLEMIRRVLTRMDLARGDKLIVIPCGIRPDKLTTNDVSTQHRATMVLLAFGGIPSVEIDLSDLENETFTRTWDLWVRYSQQYPDAEIWHVVGRDLIDGGRAGDSKIQRSWFRGTELFLSAKFLVLSRDGQPPRPEDLSPWSEVTDGATGSSSIIRSCAASHQPLGTLVSAQVRAYITRWALYTGRQTNGQTTFQVQGPGLIWSVAPNPDHPWPERETRIRELVQMAERANTHRTGPPDHILVVGGDGGMLDAIHQLHHLRLPFIGINGGTVGYLLNRGPIGLLEQGLCQEPTPSSAKRFCRSPSDVRTRAKERPTRSTRAFCVVPATVPRGCLLIWTISCCLND